MELLRTPESCHNVIARPVSLLEAFAEQFYVQVVQLESSALQVLRRFDGAYTADGPRELIHEAGLQHVATRRHESFSKPEVGNC